MSIREAQNKSIVRKYAELTNARDLDAAFAHFSPSFIDHAVRLAACRREIFQPTFALYLRLIQTGESICLQFRP